MKRSFLLYFLVTLMGIVLIGRLFQLQIMQDNKNNPLENATVKAIYNFPERGYMFDRNGKLMVANQVSYDVLITPNKVKLIDTIAFCSLLKITKNSFIKRFKKAKKYSPWLPSVFLKQLSKEDFAYLQEKLYKFKGFEIQKRSIRNYPEKSAANVVGYISEVSEIIAKKNNYYQQGELIGKWGLEKQYETVLRGKKGKKLLQRNRFNKIIGSYKDGKYDTLPVHGKDITLTIDSELQLYGEQLMKGKRGGIVAIEPATGEILALITAPSYDPNMLVGRIRSKNSVKLFNDTINKPMINRALQAVYSPGSPFKIMNALIGLEEGVIDKKFFVYCHHGYRYGNRKNEFMKCHCGIVNKPIRLKTAIAKSCNSYFATTYRKIIDHAKTPSIGMDIWSKHVKSFGFGNFLGYDLPSGQKGLIPNGKYYDSRYTFKWGATTTISNAIGQGEIQTTPIQLANFTAAIANKGFFYTPHIVKKIDNKPITNPTYIIPKKTTISSEHFPPIIDAMYEVFKTGTGQFSKVKGIDICGKTGTVENFVRINGEKIQLPDHSIFIAFAPKENPKIALAIFIENGGYGSSIAAPIASLLIEKYLKKEISRKMVEKRILNLSLEDIYIKQIKKTTNIEKREK